MAMLMPKTIVISLPNRAATSLSMSSVLNTGLGLSDSSGVRKRRRLTHLSQDERMMRRKLKNRIAAQTARDRKKEKMDTLEEQLTSLEEENQRLKSQNATLQQKTTKLVTENASLKERLCAESREASHGLESAALRVSLPKEQTRVMFQLMTHYIAFLMTLNLVHSWKSSKSLPERHQKSAQVPQIPTEHKFQWWGPQQRSWNPSKN